MFGRDAVTNIGHITVPKVTGTWELKIWSLISK